MKHNKTSFFLVIVCISMFLSSCTKEDTIPYVSTEDEIVSDSSSLEELNTKSIISVNCKKNLILNKYNIQVDLDGESIGQVEHGTTIDFTDSFEPGEHTICISTLDFTPYNYVRIPITIEKNSCINLMVECKTNELIVTDNENSQFSSKDFIAEWDQSILEQNDYYKMIGGTERRFAEFIDRFCYCMLSIYETGNATMTKEADTEMMDALGIALQYYYDNECKIDPKINEVFSILYTSDFQNQYPSTTQHVEEVLDLSYNSDYGKFYIACVHDFSKDQDNDHKVESIDVAQVVNTHLSEDNIVKTRTQSLYTFVKFVVSPRTVDENDFEIVVENPEIIDVEFNVYSYPERVMTVTIYGKKSGSTTFYVQATTSEVRSEEITVIVE